MAITRDQVIDTVLGRSIRPGNTNHLADLVRELNILQSMTLERGYPKPWFLLDVAETTVDGTGWKAPTPSGFIELYEEEPSLLFVASDNSGLQPLEMTGRANVEASLASPNSLSAVSVMEGYFLFGTKLTAGATLRVLYYRSEPLNETAYGDSGQPSPNRWLQYASDLMIAELGHLYCRAYSRDKDGLASFEQDRMIARNRVLLQENTGRKEMAQERFLNGALYPVFGAPRTITQLT